MGFLGVETCVLTHMTKGTNHLNKDLSSVKKPRQHCRTRPPPTFYISAQTDTFVDVMMDLYPGGVVAIVSFAKEMLTEDVVCVLAALPVARVMERPAEKMVLLEVQTIGQDKVRLKPIVSINVIGIPFFMTTLPRSSNLQPLRDLLPSEVRSQEVRDTSYTMWLYLPTVIIKIGRPGSPDLLGSYTPFQ